MSGEPHPAPVAVERSDIPPRLIGWIALGAVLFVVTSAAGVMAVYHRALHGPSDAPTQALAAPPLQLDEPGDLAAYRAAQQGQLDSYGWVDRGRGLMRIPVSQAMADIAAAGIPDWPK